ncbi:hypothetical protein C4566_01495 [Candidatus Parcubacteria bacterium]|nr:MAG: hypothetical protein C4566_01495 [Candidatus Parcubacteria bacterium]
MALKYHKLFIHDHLNARELSEVYLSDANDFGRLFILLEVPKNKIDQQPLIDRIINEAATYFETAQQQNPEILLEEILHQLNQIMPDIGSASKIRNWLNQLDLAIGIISQDDIFMAGIGNINAILIQHNQLTSILEKNVEINPSKIFSDIISGTLDQGDTLIVSTDSLFDYISKEKIKQLAKKYSPQGTVIKTNELLETVPDFVTFNSLFIKNSTEVDLDAIPEKNEMPEKEESILTIKSPNIAPAKSKFGSDIKTKTVVDINGFKNISFFKKLQRIFSLIWLFFVVVKRVFAYIFKHIKSGLLFVFSKKYRQSKETETLDSIKNITDNKVSWWQNLSLKKKISLGGFFIVMLIFLQSLVIMTQQKDHEEKNEAFDEAMTAIQANYTEMEAKLIYNDEVAAEEFLMKNLEILDNLQAMSPEQEIEIAKQKENLFYKLNKVRHINVIPEPVELFDLSAVIDTPKNIVQKNGQFYILVDNKLYTIENESLNVITDFTGQYTAEAMTDWSNENKLVISTIDEAQKIKYSIFDLNSKKISAVFEPSANNTTVTDLVIYGDNLYALDAKNNQIFKYPESGAGFGKGVAWLQQDIDLSTTNNLTIDGSIYTIDNNGLIRNFLKGVQEKFDYDPLRPAIGPNTIIKTFKDSAYLYLIDPQNMRIIILGKDGKIKDQYASQKFDNLIDLAIDPEEKAIYLLNGEHLYLLAINE